MKLLREYFELCEGGICQDLLTEDEKRRVASGAIILSGVMQRWRTIKRWSKNAALWAS